MIIYQEVNQYIDCYTCPNYKHSGYSGCLQGSGSLSGIYNYNSYLEDWNMAASFTDASCNNMCSSQGNCGDICYD